MEKRGEEGFSESPLIVLRPLIIRRAARGADVLGHRPQVPDDAQPGHGPEQVVGDVDLPPEKPLAGGDGIVVVVVVPPLAQGDEGQGEVVAAGVRGGVAPAAGEAVARGLAAVSYAGDISVSLDPALRASTAVGAAFPGAVDLSGVLAARIPIGLTPAAQAKVETARSALAVAQAALEAARAAAYANIHDLYRDASLARAEIDVLETEAEAARANAEVARSRYEAGEIPLTELKKVEDDLSRAQDALLQGGLAQRLSWLELVYATGEEKQPGEPADASAPPLGELPAVTELVDWSASHVQSVIEQRARVDAVEQALRGLRALPADFDARLTGSYLSHTATLTVDTASRALGATYSFPVVSGSNAPSTWSIGLSAGVSLNSGGADRLARAALEADLAREKERLAALLRTVELGIRSRYQQWIRAKDGVEQAQRSLERASEAAAIVEARIELGQAAAADRLLAGAAVDRARWNLDKAYLTAEGARIAAALSAGYLAEIARGQ